MAQTQFGKSYHSFSGVDIRGVFGITTIAELQAISYSITREKAPLYTMGSADPRSFSRGKRGIAGTLIFIMFDRHALLSTFGVGAPTQSQLYFLANADDFKPSGALAGSNSINASLPIVQVGNPNTGINSPSGIGGTGFQAETTQTTVDSDSIPALPWFVDQIPPFDVTLAAANEYGSLAVMRIYGVEVLNEGYGVSIDDIVSEMQNTYIALTLASWTPVALDPSKAALLNSGLGNSGT